MREIHQELQPPKQLTETKTVDTQLGIDLHELQKITLQALERSLGSKLEIINQHYLKIEQQIEEQAINSKAFLTLPEAAKYLGFSDGYLYQLTSKCVIPHSKPNGKKLFFSRQELDNWVLSNKQQSRDEIRQSAEDFLVTGKRA